MPVDISLKTYSRAIPVLMILSLVGGLFGELYVPSLMLGQDAAATAANLRANDGLFRLGFAAYLVEAISDILIAWIFYVLLRPVHRDLALLSALFAIVSTMLFAVTKLLYFAAPMFVRGSPRFAAFPPEQLDALATIFLSLYGVLSGVTMLFYGIPWIIRGYLVVHSGYLPRWLGLIMAVAGLGFAAKTLTYVLAPAYSSPLWLAPMFLNLLAVSYWLLVRGIDRDGWDRAVAARGKVSSTQAN